MKKIFTTLMVVVSMLAMSFVAVPAQASSFSDSQEVRESRAAIIKKFNVFRSEVSARPVTEDARLQKIAQKWVDQFSGRVVSDLFEVHINDPVKLMESEFGEDAVTVVGDIVARVPHLNVRDRAADLWRLSPDHYRILTDKSYTSVGMGYTKISGGSIVMIAVFAKVSNSDSIPLPPTPPVPPHVVVPPTASVNVPKDSVRSVGDSVTFKASGRGESFQVQRLGVAGTSVKPGRASGRFSFDYSERVPSNKEGTVSYRVTSRSNGREVQKVVKFKFVKKSATVSAGKVFTSTVGSRSKVYKVKSNVDVKSASMTIRVGKKNVKVRPSKVVGKTVHFRVPAIKTAGKHKATVTVNPKNTTRFKSGKRSVTVNVKKKTVKISGFSKKRTVVKRNKTAGVDRIKVTPRSGTVRLQVKRSGKWKNVRSFKIDRKGNVTIRYPKQSKKGTFKYRVRYAGNKTFSAKVTPVRTISVR